MAKKIVNTQKISHEEWLQLRKGSIGGSDAGALVGMNPWSSPLQVYLDKKGISEEKETSEAMRLGTDLEDYVARRWMEKTGKTCRNDNFMYAHDEYDFITANIDRVVVGENAGLECKTTRMLSRDNEGEVPAYYYAQCQHYMLVKGFERMYLAVFDRTEPALYDFIVERNDDFINNELLPKEIEFWHEFVVKCEMPAPTEDDVETVKKLYPKAAESITKQLFGVDANLARLNDIKKLQKDLKSESDKLQAMVCNELGEAECGMSDSYKVTWKNMSRSTFDNKKLKAERPEVYELYSGTTEYRKFDFKSI